MKLYVGNLSYDLTEDDLKQQFSEYGAVESVSIISDRDSGRPKGFAFVEMPSKTEAEAAILALNGKMLNERTIVVNEARPKTDNRSSGGYGGNRSGGGSGYGGNRGGGGSGYGGNRGGGYGSGNRGRR
ncbi:MAG: RNA-binding protein [Dehalococcoidales bacterium]|nr:RNA-binding protein [Dehalococcoidales bacterium]